MLCPSQKISIPAKWDVRDLLTILFAYIFARNSLRSSRTVDFMVLSMNKDLLLTLDLDKVLNRWVKQK